jgi:hypothetical protein
MDIMIPVWQETLKPQIAKSDLKSLQGVSVALVDDNYDPSFTGQLENKLQELYGAVLKRLLKPHGSAPSPKSLIEEAAQCRVAVVGIGL